MRDLGLTYEQAMHGVQAGIAYAIGEGQTLAEPKHLRVGVDSSLSVHYGLCKLLIDKGVFTENEYMEAMRLAANEEVARWEDRIPGVMFR